MARLDQKDISTVVHMPHWKVDSLRDFRIDPTFDPLVDLEGLESCHTGRIEALVGSSDSTFFNYLKYYDFKILLGYE